MRFFDSPHDQPEGGWLEFVKPQPAHACGHKPFCTEAGEFEVAVCGIAATTCRMHLADAILSELISRPSNIVEVCRVEAS